MAARPRLLLDVTRSLRRVRHPHLSGIDRVERAYLRHVIAAHGTLIAEIRGRFHRVEARNAGDLLALLDGGYGRLDLTARLRPDRSRRMREAESMMRRIAGKGTTLAEAARGSDIYLNTGHVNLTPGGMAAIGAAGLRRVSMLHDMIPLEHPEYARPGVPEEMAGKLSAACVADLIITNSADTAERARDQALVRGLPLPQLHVLPLGLDIPKSAPSPAPETPHFVTLGTIEPRKNHALLLDIWQAMWERGERSPHLHIIGRRGWLNEEVFCRLDTAPMMGKTVFEAPDLDDAAIAQRLSIARALLFPSFAEGYGLPLAEALSLGTPAIASPLPALREVGGDVPDYLPPTDQAAWEAAIRDHMADSPTRQAQLARMDAWTPPDWPAHFAKLDSLLEGLMHKGSTTS